MIICLGHIKRNLFRWPAYSSKYSLMQQTFTREYFALSRNFPYSINAPHHNAPHHNVTYINALQIRSVWNNQTCRVSMGKMEAWKCYKLQVLHCKIRSNGPIGRTGYPKFYSILNNYCTVFKIIVQENSL